MALLNADLLMCAHLLPRAVRDVAADATAQGFSKASAHGPHSHTYAWVLHRQSLLVWRAEDGAAASVRRLTLPQAPVGRAFVEVVPQQRQQSSAVTVIVCTGAGWLYVWLDASFGGEPFVQQLFTTDNDDGASGSGSSHSGVICALAATPADASTGGPGFLAAVATSDAALHLYHGSQSGIFPRQFYHPGSGSGTHGGVLEMIGAAVGTARRVAVDMQLLSGLPHMRSSASATPALQLQLLQLDSSRWKLFVLTADALDCWLLGTVSGQQSAEQLQWSYSVYQAVLGKQRAIDTSILAFEATAAPAQQHTAAPGQEGRTTAAAAAAAGGHPSQELIYVWSAHTPESGIRHQHACAALAVEDGPSKGPRLVVSQPIDSSAALPKPRLSRHRWQLQAHSSQPSCLLLSPDGVLLEWQRGGAGAQPRLLSSTTHNLAVSCSGRSSNWQLLNGAYGVLEFVAQGSQQTAAAAHQQPLDAAKALLDRVVSIMQQEYSEGCPYRELATGLADCLSELGVLDSQEGMGMLLASSSSIVDSLPKSGTLASESLKSMLQQKQVWHGLLLVALQVGGVLQRLPPSVLATLFEHAQMLAAAAGVLEYQRACEQAAAGNDAAQQVDRQQPQASQQAIEAAGSLAAAGAGAGAAPAEQLHEIFFGRPTVSLPALFKAVAGHAAAIRGMAAAGGDGSGVQRLLHPLLGLCGLLVAAVDAAEGMQQSLRQQVFNELSKADTAGPGWLAGEGPRAAWHELAEACLLVLPALSSLPEQQLLAHKAHLPALSHLLVALRATLDAAGDPSADMVQAYQDLPWRHGQQLLQVAEAELPELRSLGVLDAAAAAPYGGAEDNDDGDVLALLPGLREALVWRLQLLAQQHRCWELLYASCVLMSHTHPLLEDQLQQQMHRERAASGAVLPADGFTRYVMHRWHSQRCVLNLLQLGHEGFTPQLQAYLADTPELLWMSQVQCRQYAPAAGSLSSAARTATAADARRLWCLTKLAVKAAGTKARINSRGVMATASARLRQLQLQAALLPGSGGGAPMQTEQLATAALKAAAAPAASASAPDQRAMLGGGLRGPDAAVAAVEVLALDAANHKTQSYRELWHSSWLAVLAATPLQDLAGERATVAQGGWQAETYQAAVRGCPLYQAFVAAAAALHDAAATSPGVDYREAMEGVANALQAEVQDASQQAVFTEVVAAAAAEAGLTAA